MSVFHPKTCHQPYFKLFTNFRKHNLELSHTHLKLNRIAHFHRLFILYSETTRNLRSSPFASLWFLFQFRLPALRGKICCFGCFDFRLESEGSFSIEARRIVAKHLWESSSESSKQFDATLLKQTAIRLTRGSENGCWPTSAVNPSLTRKTKNRRRSEESERTKRKPSQWLS